MNLHNKKIGIWGFGVVGKAALEYFSNNGCATSVMDAKQLTAAEQTLIQKYQSSFTDQKNCAHFLHDHDLIVASPGIDLRPFAAYKYKFITEADLFYHAFKKPIIAITGTIGKTSVTHLLSLLLGTQKKIVTGGNIGMGMLSLLQKAETVDYALLELSSFQLEYCTAFAPDLAIWTNFYPNHLDRHGTLDNYFKAKCMMLAHQHTHQKALVPLSLAQKIIDTLKHQHRTLHFFDEHKPTQQQKEQFPEAMFFWIENNQIMQFHKNQYVSLLNLAHVPDITFAHNWLIISATLSLLDIPQAVFLASQPLTVPSHRVEKIATINGVDFYNDSKGTIIEATIAAVKKLQGKPILLFMGGISKGVDRSVIFKALQDNVTAIFCFGAEADALQKKAREHNISCEAFATLEEAFRKAVTVAKPGDQLLFSPSGASYDLFAHYEERGEYFKKLVSQYS